MTKRAASYDIDPVTFEEKDRDNQQDKLYEPDAPEIKNRKIYTLKRQTEGPKLASQSKPDLKIIGMNQSLLQKESKLNSQSSEITNNIFKTNVASLGQSSNIFASLFSKDFNKPSINAAAKANQTQKNEQQSNKPKPSQLGFVFNKDKSSSTSIFDDKASNNLFSLPNKSLFGSSNLFNSIVNTSKSGNFFTRQTKNEDGEQEGDSAQLQKKQQMISDPSKSQIKYDYGEQNIVIKAVYLSKFKKDKGELLDCPLRASILRDQKKQIYYITIQLFATGKVIFTGLILKGKSAVKTLNNKLNNLEISAFNIDSKSNKLENHTLKLQISTENNKGEEIEFLQNLNQIIEGKTVSNEQGQGK